MMICVGLTLTVHFCGGTLAGVSAVSITEVCEATPDSCCAKKSAAKEGCCNDSVIDLSEVDDETLLYASDVSKQFIAVFPSLLEITFKKSSFKNKTTLPNYTFQGNAPPLYKLYGTYIFYA